MNRYVDVIYVWDKIYLWVTKHVTIYVKIENLFIQTRAKFTVDDYSHYLFTPRDLTNWVLGLLRYEVGVEDTSANQLLEVCAYEARRLIRDRLVGKKGLDKFDRYVGQRNHVLAAMLDGRHNLFS